jgi:hypothetical protein
LGFIVLTAQQYTVKAIIVIKDYKTIPKVISFMEISIDFPIGVYLVLKKVLPIE